MSTNNTEGNKPLCRCAFRIGDDCDHPKCLDRNPNTKLQGPVPADIEKWVDEAIWAEGIGLEYFHGIGAKKVCFSLYRKLTQSKAPVPRWIKAIERLPKLVGLEGPIFRAIESKVFFGKCDHIEEDEGYVCFGEDDCGDETLLEISDAEWLEEITAPEAEDDKSCVTGCKVFDGRERRHHKDCPHYPGSMSADYDRLENELSDLKTHFEKDPIAYLLTNALRYLTPDQLTSLADSLYERTPAGSGIRERLAAKEKEAHDCRTALSMAWVELKALYNKTGYTGSNVLSVVAATLEQYPPTNSNPFSPQTQQ